MREIKVLPLPRAFDNLRWLYGSKKSALQELRSQGLIQIKPYFHHNGWYYNRITKHSWYEWNKVAFLADAKQFLFRLKSEDVGLLDVKLINAIKTIISYHKEKSDLSDMLYYHYCNDEIRNIYRSHCRVNNLFKDM